MIVGALRWRCSCKALALAPLIGCVLMMVVMMRIWAHERPRPQ